MSRPLIAVVLVALSILGLFLSAGAFGKSDNRRITGLVLAVLVAGFIFGATAEWLVSR